MKSVIPGVASVRDATTSEIAAALGMSPATVQKYARERRIPFSETPGGHRRFDVEEVRLALGLPGTQPEPGESEAQPSARVVILTSLQLEFEAVFEYLRDPKQKRLRGGTRYEIGSFQGEGLLWEAAVAEIGPGNLGAATETARAIDVFDPDVVLFVGVAGSLKPKSAPHGTVVVANRVYLYHSGKGEQDFAARPISFPTWHGLDQLVVQVRRTPWLGVGEERPAVELKPIAAGEVVVASRDSDIYRLLERYYNDAVAVDMESAGMYEAAHRSGNIAALAIRGISDVLEDKTPDSDRRWQPIAARNAAAFAFALLKAAGPEDIDPRPRPSPYPSELAELLGRVAPTVAVALDETIRKSPEASVQLLRHLTSERPPHELVRELISREPDWIEDSRALEMWVAVGEFAASHMRHAEAALAFERAAELARPKQKSRWFARAAFAAAGSDDEAKARSLLTIARRQPGAEIAWIEVVEAAVGKDPQRILEATQKHGHDEGLVDLIHATSLWQLGKPEEALALLERILSSHPSHAMTGGASLLMARLLVNRVVREPFGGRSFGDGERAMELALRARDIRRAWGGPSGEAAAVAAAAAFELHDYAAALRIALPPPQGEATEEEAREDELSWLAAQSALASGEPKYALELAGRIENQPRRLLVEAHSHQALGAEQSVVARLYRESLQAMPDDQVRFGSYLGLAELGEWPLPGFDEYAVRNAEEAQLIHAEWELAEGKWEAAIARYRRIGTLRALHLSVIAYHRWGKREEAINVLKEGARRFGRPELRGEAARFLASEGRFEEALKEAESALAAAASTVTRKQLRRLVLQLSNKVGDWAAMAAHARAAIGEGFGDLDTRWAYVWALYYQREFEEADAALRQSPALRARDEQEAILILQVIRQLAPDENAVTRILEVAEQFPASEDVSALAFAILVEATRELLLPEPIVERMQQLRDGFFERFPGTQKIVRIDASDPAELFDYVRRLSEPRSQALEDLLVQVQQAQEPLGILAAVSGHSYAEAIIKQFPGCLLIAVPEPGVIRAEDEAAKTALGHEIVADSTSLHVAGLTGREASELFAHFSRFHISPATLDDAIQARNTLSMKSTMTMGWNSETQQPVVTEIDESQAESWAIQAERLVSMVRRGNVVPNGHTTERDVVAEALIAPLELAKARGFALYSDDAVIRAAARNEGIPAFGTYSLLRILREVALTKAEVEEAFVQLRLNRAVDLPLNKAEILEIAERQDYVADAAALVISRVATWRNPPDALDLYRELLSKICKERPGALQEWCYAAAVGAARAGEPRGGASSIAFVLVYTLLQTAPEAENFRSLLEAARAAASQTGAEDPLLESIAQFMSLLAQQMEPNEAAQFLAHLIQNLDEADRNSALRAVLSVK